MKNYKDFLNIVTKEMILDYYVDQNHTKADCHIHFNDIYQITPKIFDRLLQEYKIYKPVSQKAKLNQEDSLKKRWYTNGIDSTFSQTCPEGYHPGRGPKKLTAEEQANADILNQIINTEDGEEFKNYYWLHTVAETLEHYKIRNKKLLNKILIYFGYDFSKNKPSKFKDKQAARSHENYVEAGKKSAKTQKQHWEEKTPQDKQAWSEKQKEAHSTIQFKEKIKQINTNYWLNLPNETKEEIRIKKQIANKNTWKINGESIVEKQWNTCLKKYGESNYTKTKEYKNKISTKENLAIRAQKTYTTKKLHKSFNSSKPEEIYYKILVQIFGEGNIKREFRDESRYPFNCDFYIKSKDLFIELNLHWSHGHHIFDPTDHEDQLLLEEWQEKAKTSDYYVNAIETWTIRDLNKIKCAKANNLKYKIYYTLDEALDDIKNLK